MSDRKINVVVNGKTYAVEVSDPMASSMTVTVNGKAYSVDVAMEGGVSPVVRSAPASHAFAGRAAAVSAPAAKPATQPQAPAQPLVGRAPEKQIRSPMPGVILDIAAKVGDRVTVGQQVCALDAMKMKNAIRSPIEGVISSIEVSDGQKVAYGQVLFQFE